MVGGGLGVLVSWVLGEGGLAYFRLFSGFCVGDDGVACCRWGLGGCWLPCLCS